jgi:hypothetical protein
VKRSWLLRPLVALAALAPAGLVQALTCPSGTTLVQWPAGVPSPTWEMCVLPPTTSSGTDGSGIELRQVFYKGHQVFKRANTPILNVNYMTGCGCYRDWIDGEVKFQVYKANPVPGNPPVLAVGGPGAFVDAVEPPLTVCETGGSGGDVPSGSSGFRGVAVERLSDRLILTSQLSAGWYRYMIK